MTDNVQTNDINEQQVDINDPDVAIQSLVDLVEDLASTVLTIQKVLNNGMFKYMSKTARTEIFSILLSQAGDVDDTSKAVFRQLKKIKRERMPEIVSDALIGLSMDVLKSSMDTLESKE